MIEYNSNKKHMHFRLLLLLIMSTYSMFSNATARRRRLRREQRKQAAQKNNLSSPLVAYNDLASAMESELNKHPLFTNNEHGLQFEEQDVNQNKSIDTTAVIDDTVDQKAKELEIKEEPANIELYFEDADLKNFIEQIEDIFDVVFITDEALDPSPKDSAAITGNKITFRTSKPITRSATWNYFNTFLNIAGFAVVPHPTPKTYQITSLNKAKKSPIKAYIGVESEKLPDTKIIRYLYFVQNTTVKSLQPIIDSLRSSTSDAVPLPEHHAYLITDTAYNIKVLLEIIKELDKVSTPQSMSVVKLFHVDAQYVKELYDELIQKPKTGPGAMFNRKQPTTLLPENVRIIVEPRTNALILLGPQKALKTIERFVTNEIDVDPEQPYSPVHVHQLKHADAETVADIMNKVTQFGSSTEAGKSGGIRAGDKFLQPISFVAEKATNQLIVKGQYDDYLIAKEIIDDLDVAQPQIAAEILILAVDIQKEKELGSQLRSKSPGGVDGFLGQNVEFQTSGLRLGGSSSNVVTSDSENGTQRLLGNLVELVTGKGTGNTVLSLGRDLFGVWGIFDILQKITNTQVISNPFLTATNKTPATVSLGERRRVVSATIVGGSDNNLDARDDDDAVLEVTLTPQINSDGMILLDLDIKVDNFTNPDDFNSATKQTRLIKTSTIIADKEILALGGLIRDNITNDMSKTPILGDIPIIGWFFKNKRKNVRKTNLLVLISASILHPDDTEDMNKYTDKHIVHYKNDIKQIEHLTNRKDPIHQAFFAETKDRAEEAVDNLIFRHRNKNKNSRKNKRRQRRKKKKLQLAEKQRPKNKQSKTTQITPKDTTIATNKRDTQKQRDLEQMLLTKKRTDLSLSNMVNSATNKGNA